MTSFLARLYGVGVIDSGGSEALLRGPIQFPVVGMGSQPVPEQKVAQRFRCPDRKDVQVDLPVFSDEHPVAVPPRLAKHVGIPRLFECRDVRLLRF